MSLQKGPVRGKNLRKTFVTRASACRVSDAGFHTPGGSQEISAGNLVELSVEKMSVHRFLN